jgi:hypothetical protein
MIWIQFSNAPDAPPSTAFSGAEVKVWIKVLTDPPVEGIAIKKGRVVYPDGSKSSLNFDERGVASLELKKSQHQEGEYTVQATATKEGYRDTSLSASFYYLAGQPDLAEPGFAV